MLQNFSLISPPMLMFFFDPNSIRFDLFYWILGNSCFICSAEIRFFVHINSNQVRMSGWTNNCVICVSGRKKLSIQRPIWNMVTFFCNDTKKNSPEIFVPHYFIVCFSLVTVGCSNRLQCALFFVPIRNALPWILKMYM